MGVGALLLSMFSGVAAAATFVCDTVPCYGTSNNDTIGERDGSVHDEIFGLGGDDRINVARTGSIDAIITAQAEDLVVYASVPLPRLCRY